MSVLRYALPLFLLVYFLSRSMRQRIFLLGIPFLMFQNLAVFFNKAWLIWLPGGLEPVDLMMIWLVIVWVVFFDFPLPARRRVGRSSRVFGPALSSPEEFVLIGIAALAALEFPLTVLRFGAIGPALGEAKSFIYLFVGYFLLRGMFSRANRRDTVDLVTALVVVNTVAAGFFVLHQGLHLPIYEGANEYQSLVFGGQLLTRSFYFMPQLITLALAFCFAKPKWGLFWMAVLFLNMAALWVSYTRTLIVIAAVELVVILGLRMLKANQAGQAIRRALVIVVIVVVAGAIAFVVLPAESRYFMSRIAQTDESGTLTGDSNLQNRSRKMQRIYDSISTESVLFGQGYAAPGQEEAADDIYGMSADVVWVPVLYRLGILGVVGFIAAYGLFGWRALRLTLTGRGEAEFLTLVVLGALVGQLLGGLTSWTILDPQRYPMGLWLFAILAAEACRRRVDADAATPLAEKVDSIAA